jgi:hypothetical protein
MSSIRSEFVRQSPRAPLACQVMVILELEGLQALGETVDLSETGISVVIERRLRARERVTLLLDPAALPVGDDGVGLPTMVGTVAWTTRDKLHDGKPLYRSGITFVGAPDRLRRRLRALQRRLAQGADPCEEEVSEAELAQGAPGRERLYQRALERLAVGDHAGARDATRASLRVIPHARHMRALLCRIEAEAALARKDVDEARRRTGHGRGLLPEDPVWDALDARATGEAPTARRGFFTRLFPR